MINEYLRGRACIETVRGSLFQGDFSSLSFSCSASFAFELFLLFSWVLPLFVPFIGLAAFSYSR
jgi:hypothetical protein